MSLRSRSMGSREPARVLITTGDVDGIGWEVTAKALHSLGPKTGVQFVVYRHRKRLHAKPRLSVKFRKLAVAHLADAVNAPFDAKTVIEVQSEMNPAFWVEEAARACLHKQFQA